MERVNDKIRRVAEREHIVCLYLVDFEEPFLVGIVEAYDEEGIVFYNIDFRGYHNGRLYFSKRRIQDIVEENLYLHKLKMLFHLNGEMIERADFVKTCNLKLSFLKWLQRNQSIVRIAVKEEEFLGRIRNIEGDNVCISLMDWTTKEAEGCMIILQKYLDFFGEELCR